ncbi:uncharacterized protein LTR77_001420 [Saxophila tyrrhenica]|uniref:Uncharacterized protein n=1 Tax=Saxophila tyrrhenica TaxID=1690608 RepID=A0AAV9PK84_9PEZI|nr:hypothetical protein LTR77_001420 [Saxophila tyrrhenica]
MAVSAYEKLDRPNDDTSGSEGEHYVSRTSEDVRQHDRETLNAEEEAERLLVGDGSGKSQWGRKKEQRKDRRRQKGRGGEEAEKRELMYEMEEGGPRNSSTESIGSSSEGDMQRLGEVQSRRKTSRTKRWTAISLIHVVIIAAFLALLYGAYRATQTSTNSHPSTSIAQTLFNGTHTFAPTTIFLSLDGFRADFLNRGLTPTLNAFMRTGVSPEYMNPSFPSLTFPNHFTLVTGLHPESHGIVGNTFWDPTTEKEFYYTDPARSMTPEWWNAEPIWVTAEQQNVRSAIHMWPGSEAHIAGVEPEYVDEFDADEKLGRKVDRILHWLDMPGDQDVEHSGSGKAKQKRPQLIAAYTPNVDADGHKYGPNSTYIRSTIAEVDGMLGALFKGIDERNLTNIVNIIVVSDHGMATTSTNRLVQLEDLVDTSLIEHTDGWPLYGLRPYKRDDAQLIELYNQLFAKSKLPKYRDAFDVYLRDKNMPERYHFHTNPRIAPLWIIPKAGWAIVTKDEFDIAAAKKHDDVYHPRGLHGYDHEHPLMRAIFVARGPAFPHPEGSKVRAFQNTEVYNIVCDSLGIEPQPNNGTLRLPFTTEGKHDFISVPEEVDDLPADETDDDEDTSDGAPPPEVPNLNNPTPPHLGSPSPPEATKLGPIEAFQPIPPDVPARPTTPERPEKPERPVVHDGGDPDAEDAKGWWEWVKQELEKLKGLAKDKFGHKDDGKEKSDGKKKNMEEKEGKSGNG